MWKTGSVFINLDMDDFEYMFRSPWILKNLGALLLSLRIDEI